jgi:hypothetical protein
LGYSTILPFDTFHPFALAPRAHRATGGYWYVHAQGIRAARFRPTRFYIHLIQTVDTRQPPAHQWYACKSPRGGGSPEAGWDTVHTIDGRAAGVCRRFGSDGYCSKWQNPPLSVPLPFPARGDRPSIIVPGYLPGGGAESGRGKGKGKGCVD